MIKEQKNLMALFSEIQVAILSLLMLSSIACTANDTLHIIKSPSLVRLTNLKQKTSRVSLGGGQEYYLFIFLSPECPLCQNYCKDINELFIRYNHKIAFYGIIAGKAYSPAQVNKFDETYKVRFDLLFDPQFQLAKLLNATTTPQAVLINSKNEIIYAGKIDNWASGLGVKRIMITEHYLEDAIFASLNNMPVKLRFTHPVGCLINNY